MGTLQVGDFDTVSLGPKHLLDLIDLHKREYL